MQHLIVALIVLVAAWSVAMRYLPVRWRDRIRQTIAQLAGRLGWPGLAARMRAKSPSAGACGDGCGSCNNCDTPAPTDYNKLVKEHRINIDGLRRNSGRVH